MPSSEGWAFDLWDVVKLPFPYTDRPVRERRPAVVIAAGDLLHRHGLLWVIMITAAENRGWAGDVPVSDLAEAGLPAPSIVRPAKIAVIDARDAQRLGSLPNADRSAVSADLANRLRPLLTGVPNGSGRSQNGA